jgi:hypothetical protein
MCTISFVNRSTLSVPKATRWKLQTIEQAPLKWLLNKRARIAYAAIIITFLKSGFRITYNLDTFRDSITNFRATAYWRTSLALPLFANLFNLRSQVSWIIAYAALALCLVLLLLAYYYIFDRTISGLFVCTCLASSQVLVVAFTEIGRFDIFVLLGSVLVGLFDSRILIVIGASMIALGNFEHFIVIGITLTFLLPSCDLRHRPNFYYFTFVLTALTHLAIQKFYFGRIVLFENDSRATWLSNNALTFSLGNLTSLPVLLFSCFGTLWLVVARIIQSSDRIKVALMRFSGLILIPLLLTFATADGTRVFVSLSTVGLALMTRTLAQRESSHEELLSKLGVYVFLATLFMPALNVEVLGKIKQPYVDLTRFFFHMS